jgi:glycine hydroxymethyltransferase
MARIVELIDAVLTNHDNDSKLEAVRKEVNSWMQQYPLFAY